MKNITKAIVSGGILLSALGFGAGGLLAADTYSIDGAHSFVFFKVGHFGLGKVVGRFNGVSGQLQTAGNGSDALTGLSISIDAASVDTNITRRDNHLRSPDFLSAVEYPEITFVSTAVQENIEEEGVYEVTGDLSLHGVTQTLTITVNRTGAGEFFGEYRIGGETQFTVSRSAFGMVNSPDVAGDTIEIIVNLEAERQ